VRAFRPAWSPESDTKASVRPMQRLRRYFITGFFVTVPLVISVAALVWIFDVVDGVMAPVFARALGRNVPGLGLLTTVLLVLAAGMIATNVIGRQLLQRTEQYLMMVPVFRTIYAPVKQLILAFSPDNEAGFKRVVMVDDPHRGLLLGFLTREFMVDLGTGPAVMVAVYFPTNHLYLGDVLVFPADRVKYPDITVEQGIRIFLTGGMALPGRVQVNRRAGNP
jgi:uncharacterized membrane protein